MESIKDWINNGKPWALGVAIFNAHSDNEQLKKVFAQGQSDYRRKLLDDELRKIKDKSTVVTVQASPQKKATQITIVQADEANTIPADKDPYRKDWLPLYIKMQALRHKLPYITDLGERGAIAFEILHLDDACVKYWQKAEHYLRYGTHMEYEGANVPHAITDTSILEHKLRNARTLVTKYQKDPTKAHLLEAKQKLVEELERQIPRNIKRKK